MKKFKQNNSTSFKGFGLIEVLVALLVLSIGLLGLINLQIRGHQYSDSSRQRSQATFLAYDILDRMRANREVAITGAYDLSMGSTVSTPTTGNMCSSVSVTCTPDTLADFDLWEWEQDLRTFLPNGDGSIVKDATILTADVYQITIQWNRKAFSEADRATAIDTQLNDSIVIETEI